MIYANVDKMLMNGFMEIVFIKNLYRLRLRRKFTNSKELRTHRGMKRGMEGMTIPTFIIQSGMVIN